MKRLIKKNYKSEDWRNDSFTLEDIEIKNWSTPNGPAIEIQLNDEDELESAAFLGYEIIDGNQFKMQGYTMIWIDMVSIEEQYKGTNLFTILMNAFEEQVLNPQIQKSGKENTFIAAEFVNNDLEKRLIENYKSEGIKVINIESISEDEIKNALGIN